MNGGPVRGTDGPESPVRGAGVLFNSFDTEYDREKVPPDNGSDPHPRLNGESANRALVIVL